MPNPSHIVYLHGLGGSPLSAKGVLLHDHFTRFGITTVRPALSVPSFQNLSPLAAVQRVVDVLTDLAQESSVALVGSSFGAFLGLHALSRVDASVRSVVHRVVLLAPLFDPFDPTSALVNPVNEARWRGDGVFSLLDLTTGQQTPVHYRFVEELRLLVSRPLEVEVPTLVVHGDRDEVVRSEQSRRFAAGRPNVQLRITQDDHGLLADPAGLAAVVESFLLERST